LAGVADRMPDDVLAPFRLARKAGRPKGKIKAGDDFRIGEYWLADMNRCGLMPHRQIRVEG